MIVSLAPYVPSQPEFVRRMLEIAKVDEDDIVFDLGCGDGRILVSAIRDFGAKKAVGYEIRRDLYQRTLEKVESQDLLKRIEVFNGDLLEADISEATVITLYLTTSANTKLKPKLAKEAEAGTRIVSHDYEFRGWSYTQKKKFPGHTIFIYEIPRCLTRAREG